jgi:type IV secretory pathway VirD2 relaxase
MGGHGMAAARRHLDYIVREGVEPDGSKGELFGDEKDVREALHAELEGEKHQFRLIVSPEDRGIDLRSFTRALMRQVQVDLGRDLIWGAVQHHDTDNPHAHLVIRGVDRQGRELRMDRDYISNVIRWRAQAIATNELGPRSDYAIGRQRDREVEQDRFTSLDRELERRSNGTVSLSALKGLPSDQRARMVGRLRVLEQLALARRRSPGTWALVDGWQQSLRGLSERGDIIKRMHAATAEKGLTSRYRVIDGRSDQAPVIGVLRRKGLHDEQRGDMYAIVEDPSGGAHYVRINATTADRVKEGAIVRVASVREKWTKPIDAAVVAFGSEHGGIYDPKAHLAALTGRPATDRGRRVEPSDLVEASRRRLEWLGRHKLVVPLGDGRWRLPSDLSGQLAARDGTRASRRRPIRQRRRKLLS